MNHNLAEKNLRKFFHHTAVVLNVIVAIPLFISIISVYFNPSKYWIMAFPGLGFPYFLLINMVFIIYWIIRLKLTFLISTIAILCGIHHIKNFVQLTCNNDPAGVPSGTISVMSYNVRLFDIYEWSGTKKAPQKIISFVMKEKPDILCLQEFVSGNTTIVPTFDTLPDFGKLNNQYYVPLQTGKKKLSYGIVTFSNYPIVNKGFIRFEHTNNFAIFTDLEINYDTLRVYNVHLQSVHFETKNYRFLDSISLNYDEYQIKGIKDIGRKLKKAYILRSKQADSIAAHISKSPWPVIVCGDFNDTPVSYAYTTLRKNLNDAFVQSGCGIEYTYPGKFSSFRIDYILHSKNINSYHYRTSKIDYSDHYPVCCEFIIK